MNVEILVDGPYAKFDVRTSKVTSQQLKKGDVAEFPDDYAQGLIDVELAKASKVKPAVAEVHAREVIFGEDLDSELSLPEQMKIANAERHSKEEATAKDVNKLLKGKRPQGGLRNADG